MERISEIGTMRAIGAKRTMIKKLIITETMMITLFFGLLGTVLGVAVIYIFKNVGLTAPNYYMSILFGGEVLNPTISPGSLGLSIISIFAAGALSGIYPVMLANRINPIRAIQKGGI